MLIQHSGATPAAPLAAFRTPPAEIAGAAAAAAFMVTPMVSADSYPVAVLVRVTSIRLALDAVPYTLSFEFLVSRAVVRTYGAWDITASETASSKKSCVTKLSSSVDPE